MTKTASQLQLEIDEYLAQPRSTAGRVTRTLEPDPAKLAKLGQLCRCGHARGEHVAIKRGGQQPCLINGCDCELYKVPSKAERDAVAKATHLAGRFTSGDRAWAILTEDIGSNAEGKNRRQIYGAGQVQILDGRGDRVRVRVIKGSPAHSAGMTFELLHADVYQDNRDGRLAFQRAIEQFYGAGSRKK